MEVYKKLKKKKGVNSRLGAQIHTKNSNRDGYVNNLEIGIVG